MVYYIILYAEEAVSNCEFASSRDAKVGPVAEFVQCLIK